jgi:hypothetical protein
MQAVGVAQVIQVTGHLQVRVVQAVEAQVIQALQAQQVQLILVLAVVEETELEAQAVQAS